MRKSKKFLSVLQSTRNVFEENRRSIGQLGRESTRMQSELSRNPLYPNSKIYYSGATVVGGSDVCSNESIFESASKLSNLKLASRKSLYSKRLENHLEQRKRQGDSLKGQHPYIATN